MLTYFAFFNRFPASSASLYSLLGKSSWSSTWTIPLMLVFRILLQLGLCALISLPPKESPLAHLLSFCSMDNITKQDKALPSHAQVSQLCFIESEAWGLVHRGAGFGCLHEQKPRNQNMKIKTLDDPSVTWYELSVFSEFWNILIDMNPDSWEGACSVAKHLKSAVLTIVGIVGKWVKLNLG